MSQAIAPQNSVSSLTALLVPLADRTLLLPNVAVAELIPYRPPHVTPGLPSWFLGQVAWRDLQLPLHEVTDTDIDNQRDYSKDNYYRKGQEDGDKTALSIRYYPTTSSFKNAIPGIFESAPSSIGGPV